MKKGLYILATTGVVLGVVASSISLPDSASAKTKAAKVIKTTSLKRTAYQTTGGYIYTSAKLTKKKYNAGKYLSTKFYATKSSKIKKSNGKKAYYYYVTSSNKRIKGWIWKGNLQKVQQYAQAKKDVAAMKKIVLNMTPRAQKYIMPQFDKLSLKHAYSTENAQNNLAQVSVRIAAEVYDGNQADVAGGIAEYQLFSGRFSSSINRNLQRLYAKYLDSVNGGDPFNTQRVQATELARAMVDPIDGLQK
ncbi:hypothetical protein [Levilactobacillus suantsaiihabitans]|uniref:D-alanyl-D-alanine carboxypeptidase n=1 Tax=Levilactobacillus suantsaiihabitans TaxID=2487722 RepID=A0A4Z0J8C5_9LACO|nr:hypothetical protein [Levilactobacillus suantsaiihabitans]TGD17563.1 hypothetical protein EGT51_11900 [Levilactobacillus suantsaiihabitans]